MRSISYCIDLIPRASFPNKPPHRLMLDEKIELDRQVQELLEKGFFRESLSPCAILVVLAPRNNGEWRM